MQPALYCGLEFEYLLVNTSGPQAGRVRDFTSLDFHTLSRRLADKPGQQDPRLAKGDMGIRRGYWYLEGDERFHPDGEFSTLAVKGVEIRTPPQPGVELALVSLLSIERLLLQRLAPSGLGLAIAGINPLHQRYEFDPPLNTFELQLRAEDREYDGMEISTLTFGPDINLSLTGWDDERNLDAARKLNYYAPYIVPFSFSSPFLGGKTWCGWSSRTWVRSAYRPIVKTFIAAEQLAKLKNPSPLLRPARIAMEQGRIEFKAFDAMPSLALLKACCYLLVGLCLDQRLTGRSEHTDVSLLHRAALSAFDDLDIYAGSQAVLHAAQSALAADSEALNALTPLTQALQNRSTPAHRMRAQKCMYHIGGLAST